LTRKKIGKNDKKREATQRTLGSDDDAITAVTTTGDL
jgi:hypothetical protein